MTHLKDLATPNNNGHVQKCIYHTMILYYMDALYQDFWGVGVNHKAMYYVGSKPYKEAEASEAREQQK